MTITTPDTYPTPVLDRFACAAGDHHWDHYDFSMQPLPDPLIDFTLCPRCDESCGCSGCLWNHDDSRYRAPNPIRGSKPTWENGQHYWVAHRCRAHEPPRMRCLRCDDPCACSGCEWVDRGQQAWHDSLRGETP